MADRDDGRGCVRCNCCSLEWIDCANCGGDGSTMPGDFYDEDPLWYGPDDVETCHFCGGTGGGTICLGRCDANGKHERSVTGTENGSEARR